MSCEDIRRLDDPKEADFDARMWAAIAYARSWALNRGAIKDGRVVAVFEEKYTSDERETINALIRIMDFANRVNNTLFKPLDRRKVFSNLEKSSG